jgi:hypothetical protein
MDGVGGLEGWRWIFILEGIASVVLGVACFFLLIDTPALSARWLTPEEIRYLELSMFIKQGGTSSEETGFKWRDLRIVLSNWRIYVQAYFLLCQSTLSYGMSFPLDSMICGANPYAMQVPSLLFQQSQKPWASAIPTPNSPPLLHTLLPRYQPSFLRGCRIISTGECLLLPYQ